VLLIERRTALGLVNAVLGLSPPRLAGPLSRIERGVLEGLVATVLARLGLAGWVGLVDRAPPPTGSFSIALSLGLGSESGWACMMASDEALTSLAASVDAGRHEAPWLEVASTGVPAREVAGAEPGDKVVFDETTALSATNDWPARAIWRGRGAGVEWRTDGTVVARQGAEPHQLMRLTSCDANKADSFAMVEISAGADCASLANAGRQPLFVSRADPIVLKVNGRVWACGSPAEVDGAFAVVITRKTSG
jgi:hypothetical protein